MAAPVTTSGNPVIFNYEFLIFLALIIVFRLRRGFQGQHYSNRIFVLPILYTLILADLIYFLDLEYIGICIGFALVAIPLGLRLSENPEFFYRGNQLFFKRSNILMMLWLGGLVVRVAIEVALPFSTFIDFILSAVLAFTLGLIVGERVRVYTKGKEILSKPDSNTTGFQEILSKD